MSPSQSQNLESFKNYQITPKDLEILADYFSIIHHSKGRIRLRASSKLKNAVKESSINAQSFLEHLQKIPAIKEIKFNKLIGSLTIEYDYNIFQPSFWESSLKGEKLEEISQVINTMLKDL
ncbi:HMA2 domain-containing protein [Helicobacter mesocricetorum]|uniref:HMA2 domain-containing protein n=1 Tax=Helicobacter mesocricetorum TaxID=87012 RepID=UPI000CF1383E|nr:hypothetical protein [Helicobacter mesocricetorum]